MGSFIDYTGTRFGRLLAIEYKRENKKSYWLCECECGEQKWILRDSLSSGKSKSCGCLRKQIVSELKTANTYKHKRLYRIWLSMRDRCNNKNNGSYRRYGFRGIKVDSVWDNFDNFYEWSMNNGYNDELSIDRVNNNKGYSPDNCRWVDNFVQANNTINNVFVEIEGKILTLAQQAKKYGIPYAAIYYRHKQGVKGKDLVSKSKKEKIMVNYESETLCLKEWSRKTGISYGALTHRYKSGDRGTDLFRPVDPVLSAKAKSNKKQKTEVQ